MTLLSNKGCIFVRCKPDYMVPRCQSFTVPREFHFKWIAVTRMFWTSSIFQSNHLLKELWCLILFFYSFSFFNSGILAHHSTFVFFFLDCQGRFCFLTSQAFDHMLSYVWWWADRRWWHGQWNRISCQVCTEHISA